MNGESSKRLYEQADVLYAALPIELRAEFQEFMERVQIDDYAARVTLRRWLSDHRND